MALGGVERAVEGLLLPVGEGEAYKFSLGGIEVARLDVEGDVACGPAGLLEVGAHARGFNRCSIAVCYEGGLDELGKPADTRTPQQKQALRELLEKLHRLFPDALIVGHRDLPGVKKACPCFDARWEYR